MCDNRSEEKSNREKSNGKEPGCVIVHLGVSLENTLQLGAAQCIRRNVFPLHGHPKVHSYKPECRSHGDHGMNDVTCALPLAEISLCSR